MSIESVAKALQIEGVTLAERVILIGLANHDGDGGCWPSIATLARYACMSERQVQRWLAKLAERGVITIHPNGGGHSNTRADRRTNLYLLHLDGVTPMTPREPNGVTSGDPRGDIATSPEPSSEPSVRNTRVDLFGTFWAEYPRKESRRNAERAFERALRRGEGGFIAISAGLEAWLKFWEASKTEKRFIPHATTWLNQSRWLDDVPEVRPDPKTPGSWTLHGVQMDPMAANRY